MLENFVLQILGLKNFYFFSRFDNLSFVNTISQWLVRQVLLTFRPSLAATLEYEGVGAMVTIGGE